jgi:natural product biosynthesis luciferase-like monooxygenase protein
MKFGLMFFSSLHGDAGRGRYHLLLEAARFADSHGFSCVWTPERHFHAFGGLFPNPAVTSAALATVTRKIELRAGSLILALHDTLRAAEDWAMVDNLSGGRAAISFGSGWNVEDFVLHPERYADRHRHLYESIALFRRLWRGEEVTRVNSFGKEVKVAIFPRPVRAEIPIWVTSSGNSETFANAGAIGANVLTHLIGQDLGSLALKIQRYRDSLASHGLNPARGSVTLMLHTFLGESSERVKAQVRAPFREYLRSAISLEQMAALGGGAVSGGHQIDPHAIPEAVLEELLDVTFERYYRSAALMGAPEDCRQLIWDLKSIGVDEIACLIDFLDDSEAILESLRWLDRLRASFSGSELAVASGSQVSTFMEDVDG